MDSLYQRLRELDPDTFQRFCFHLLNERHPGAGIKHVEGAGGDEGIDSFMGQLAEGPSIWQCKSFSQGIGKSQRQQIKKSLSRALRHSPRRWILCLSVDMDAKAHRWFERLKQSYAAEVDIGLFQASDIVHELIHRRTLRNHFFPAASLDPIAIKRVLKQSGELSQEELERLTEENVEDFLERLKERDARFNYEVVFGGDRGAMPPMRPQPGVMFSVSDGKKTIHAFARDKEALESDPPIVSFTAKGTGVEKFKTFIRTGKPLELKEEEVGNITTNIGLYPSLMRGNSRLILGPSADFGQRRLKSRETFRHAGEVIDYALIEFRPVSAGTAEGEIRSIGSHPFELSLVIPFDDRPHGDLTFKERFVGADVAEINKFLRAERLLLGGAEFELYDLERSKTVLRAHARTQHSTTEHGEFEDLINTLMRIAERYKVNLRLPDGISEEDIATIGLLERYMNGESMSAEDITIVLEKSEANSELVTQQLTRESTLRMEIPFHQPKPRLFGQEIDTGPCAIHVERALVRNVHATLESFKKAAIGDGVKISFQPLSAVQFLLLSDSTKSEKQ